MRLSNWYVPVSRLAMNVDHLLTLPQIRVYWRLVSHMSYNTRLVTWSHQSLATELGYSVRTVQRAIKFLQTIGLIIERKHSKDGISANTYEIVMPDRDGGDKAVTKVSVKITTAPKREYGRTKEEE
jgi:DNA-binding MarR family transcriptional regulator